MPRPAPGTPDELRPLTPAGREQARALGRRLRERGPRAGRGRLEPAAARARDGGGARPRRRRRSTSGSRPARRPTTSATRRSAAARRCVVVGHQPDCGQAVAALTGGARAGVPAVRRTCVVELDARVKRDLRPRPAEVVRRRSQAVRGVDFEIEEGEVFGLLGPNGAGKTTTVEILEGYRTRDAGEVTRARPRSAAARAASSAQRIGVVLQQSELWPNLTVRETHAIFAGYYEQPRDVDEVIDLVGLDREARRAREDAVGRTEATARPRRRARRRSRSRLPRRADDRLRPGRAPRGLGDDPLAALARQDGAADDALPRRGGAARRPRRGDARGRDRHDRHAARADDAPSSRSRSATAATARRSSCARASRRACCTS